MNDFEIWPGPMEGVGKEEFVKAASELELTDRWMTPFIRITDNIPAEKHLFRGIRAYLDTGLPVIVQLMGSDAALLTECADILLTSPLVSGINLNLGCPSGRVVKHNSGGGLLQNPEKAVSLCCTMAEKLPPGKFSVKLRSGFNSPDDMKKILPQLSGSGVAKIFFHYRTVREAYSAAPLPERNRRTAAAVKLCGEVPLIANGDICSPEDAKNLLAETGAAGIMIARPWMRDPFLLRRFTGNPTDPESGRKRFFDALKKSGVRRGSLIEIAKMLWGISSPQFRAVITAEQV